MNASEKPDYGGYVMKGRRILEEMPVPYIRAFPRADRQRKVRVKIYSWYGMSLGATHWYGEAEEEHNPIWSGERWEVCENDRAGLGREAKFNVGTKQDAAAAVVAFIRAFFDPADYIISADNDETADLLTGALIDYNFKISSTSKPEHQRRALAMRVKYKMKKGD